jgi:choline dehydrogenase-like flavoprotein
VGAGSAGCVVAAQLVRSGLQVMLIEAGPDRDVTDPTLTVNSGDLYQAASDAHFVTDIETNTGPYRRGVGLGGSGAINGLLLHPGTRIDYDRWAERPGCSGWGSVELWPIIQRRLATGRTHNERGPVDRLVMNRFPNETTPAVFSIDANGQRACSAATDFAEVRSRVEFRTEAPVQRVLMESDRAVGVELSNGETLYADLVVVCAGVVASPLLLWRSGFNRPGIGANLHDHPSIALPVPLAHASTSPLTTVIGSIDSPGGIQILPLNRIGLDSATVAGAVMFGVLSQHGRGQLTANPTGRPRLDFAQHELDQAALRRATQHARTLNVDATLAEIDPTDIDALDRWVGANPGNYLHAAGTCRMGSPTDDYAVVDNNCQVIGVPGLYVVDASIFPDLPRANPYLPTLAVAELAAARIAGIVSASS